MKKVSVIVPVYNVEEYIDKCLNTLINQTLEDIEIIIVNDGTKDNSEEIINKYKKDYPEKIVYLKKENGGLADTRNMGLKYVTGEYIGFVDSDDYVELDMFEKMYNKAKENDADIVECDVSWIYPNKERLDIGKQYNNSKDMFIDGRVMMCNKIFKSNLFKENNIQFPKGLRYEDVEVFYKLLPYVKNTCYINKIFYYYIQREGSIANYQTEKTKDMFKILQNILEFYKNKGLYEEYKEELEYTYIRFLLGSSFLRMVKIKDKKVRKRLLKEAWNILNTTFPNWKSNKILKERKTKKDAYYRSVNKMTFRIYGILFSVIKRGNF